MLLVAGDFDGSSRFGLRQSPCLSFRGGNVLCLCCMSTDGTGRKRKYKWSSVGEERAGGVTKLHSEGEETLDSDQSTSI